MKHVIQVQPSLTNISPAAKWQQPPSGSFYLNNSTAAQVRQPPSGSFISIIEHPLRCGNRQVAVYQIHD